MLARQAKLTRARQLRVDSTGVQTPIHHPTDSATDSGLLGDGIRVLSRLIRRARPLVSEQLAGVRDAFRSRVRSPRHGLQEIHQVRRRADRSGAGEDAAEHQRELYARLLAITRQTVRQAERGRAALARRVLGAVPTAPERLARRLQTHLEHCLPLVERGIRQAHARVLDGQPVPSAQKGLSLFEPHPRVVKRGTIGAAVEFGRQVVLDEVAGGIVTRFHRLADDERECRQALPAVRHHRAVFGRPPWLVTGDRRLHPKGGEEQAHALGVTQVASPRIGRLSAAQRAREQQRAWKRRYRWRAGIEGRLHRLRRDDGATTGWHAAVRRARRA